MVFVPSTKVGEELQASLRTLGLEVPLYHSRLENAWERQELVKRFLGQSRPTVDQIICTNAFGMGLDVPNVRLVIHWQQSASVEDQLQEFGRAGRDGKPSVAVMFHNGSSIGRDISRLRFMAKKTVGSAKVSMFERPRMLEQRYHQIDQDPACGRLSPSISRDQRQPGGLAFPCGSSIGCSAPRRNPSSPAPAATIATRRRSGDGDGRLRFQDSRLVMRR